MTTVVIAPDKFRGSLSAAEAARFIAAGITDVLPGVEVDECPIADGGEGTIEAVIAAGFTPHDIEVTGLAQGSRVSTRFATQGTVALIELAAVAGQKLIPPSVESARTTTSRAVGEAIIAALDAGQRTIIVALGGSASTDGGAGMMHALGMRLRDASGKALVPGVDEIGDVVRIDRATLDPRLTHTQIIVAVDVANPLLGSEGAAVTFAPQKGADPATVDLLEGRLLRYSAAVAEDVREDFSAVPGAGAAGGVAFSAVALLGASVRSGFELVAEIVGLRDRAQNADLIITGEGSLDRQSLSGKAPLGVASMATELNIPALAVAGRCRLTPAELAGSGFAEVFTLEALDSDVASSMANAPSLIRTVGSQIARRYLTGADPSSDELPVYSRRTP